VEKRDKRIIGCVALGCGGALVLATVVGGLLIWKLAQGVTEVSDGAAPTVDALFGSIEEGDWAKVDELAHASWQGTPEYQSALSVMKQIHEERGAYLSRQQTSFNLSAATGSGTVLTGTYHVTFENGQEALQIRLNRNGGQWRVTGFARAL
jgi:hypothetical protein